MKRLLLILFSFVSILTYAHRPVGIDTTSTQLDSVALASRDSSQLGIDPKIAGLDAMLQEFYAVLIHEETREKVEQMDWLIGSVSDTQTRQHLANQIFEHYRTSKVMGEEAVAIAVYDKWFASGELKIEGEFAQMEAELFVKFNRSSLVGMQAPVIDLFRPCLGKQRIPSKGRKSVLFFYDTACAKCRLEAQLLPSVLKDVEFDLDFFAIYVGADRKEWGKFRSELKQSNRKVRVYHLWDPKMESEYQLMYGVIGTPRMFVVMEEGDILARRLEVDNLKQIIAYINIINGQEKEN